MHYSKTAAANLTTEIPIISDKASVGDAKKQIFRNINKFKTVNYVYLVDKNGSLTGVASFKHLLQQYDGARVRRLANRKLVYCREKMHIEKVAHIAVRHNIKSVPVLGNNKKLLGVISNDTIMNELYKANRRGLYKSAGIITPQDYIEDTLSVNIVESFLHRIPWVLIGLVGGLLIARVVGAFDDILQQNLLLASFIPLIVYLSAAVGAQTQALFIRDLLIKHKLPLLKYGLKQFLVTLLIAVCCAAFIWMIVYLFWHSGFLGVVIGLSALVAITASTLVALVVPYLLHLFKHDPANGSGPFATILQDFMSVLIYFTVATLLL